MEEESAAEKVRAYRPRHAHHQHHQHGHHEEETELEQDRALVDEALAHMNLSKDIDEYMRGLHLPMLFYITVFSISVSTIGSKVYCVGQKFGLCGSS